MNIIYPNATAPHSLSRLSSFPHTTTVKKRRSELSIGCRSNSINHRLCCSCLTANTDSISFGNNGGSEESGECVEVIAVGSRKDALLEFCSASPFLSPVLRFWNVLGNDSKQVQPCNYNKGAVAKVESIVLSIISMLSSPNDESPANVEAAKEWRDYRDDFKKKVSRCVRRSQEML